MKSNNRSHYIIGAAVIACSAALLAALTFALSGFPARKGARTLDVEFHDATGIKLHSEVRYAGKAAGAVSAIRFLKPEERLKGADPLNAVRVTLRLDDDVPPLAAGLTARLDAETMLGEKFVALNPGGADAKPLPAGTVVQGGQPSSIDAVARSAQAAIEKVDDILGRLKTDYPALVPRLAELLAQGNRVLAQGTNLVQDVDNVVLGANDVVAKLKGDYSALAPKLGALVTQAQGIATNADLAIGKLSGLIEGVDGVVSTNKADIAKLLQELRVVSQNLKVITTYTKTLTGTLAEKPSSVIWGRKKRELPPEQTILDSAEPVPGMPANK